MDVTGWEKMEPQPPEQDWDTTALVERVRQGSPEGEEDLYNLVRNIARGHFRRQFGAQDCLDKTHDVFLIVLEAARGGALRDARNLRGFVRTVVRYEALAEIRHARHAHLSVMVADNHGALRDRRGTPEQKHLRNEHRSLLVKAIGLLPPRDGEILVRYYLQGESKECICAELKLTATQFRLRKSRAKARACAFAQDLL